MRNKAEIIQLEPTTIRKIVSKGHVHTFPVESDLFYEGQVPFVAYLIIKGKVHFTKNKRNKGNVGPGSLLGLRELYTHTPSTLGARVFPDTEVVYLDRSTIHEIMSCDEDSELSVFFKELLLEKAL